MAVSAIARAIGGIASFGAALLSLIGLRHKRKNAPDMIANKNAAGDQEVVDRTGKHLREKNLDGVERDLS